MSTPDTTVLVVEDEDSFVEALTIGLKRARTAPQAPIPGWMTRCKPAFHPCPKPGLTCVKPQRISKT